METPKLGDLLIKAQAITTAQLSMALEEQKRLGGKLGEILVSKRLITPTRLVEALSTQLGCPMITLTRYTPMPEAIKLVPKSVAKRWSLVPLKVDRADSEGQLSIAMSDPLELRAQDDVLDISRVRKLKIYVATKEEIDNNIDRMYDLQDSVDGAIVDVEVGEANPPDRDLEVSPGDAPVIQLVNRLLQQAVTERASDVHVETYEKDARVRFRVDGLLYDAFSYPVALHPSVVARLKIMTNSMDIAEKRKPQDGRILVRISGRRIDLRVSSLPTMNGEKIVLRILEQDNAMVGLGNLGFEPDDLKLIQSFCATPHGIMLVTGPTGCGKSTTLYSMLLQLNKPDINIVTVEDPVEYTIPGINQVSLNERAGLTFASSLRSILRQDPDVIMIGEIRDQETAQIAIRAAQTGHLVLSTLHTNDALSATTRLIDMGIQGFLVSDSVSGVMAQRLVRQLCPHCREEYEISEKMCSELNLPIKTHAYRAKGCNECRNGYRGRRGIFEIVQLDEELKQMITKGASHIELRKCAIEKGMKTLKRSGINAALAGVTSLEEVLTVAI